MVGMIVSMNYYGGVMKSKSVLEIPTPKCCAECRICFPEINGWRCPLEQGVLIKDEYSRRTTMDWCELKDLPKKRVIDHSDPEWKQHYEQGINDTISMIEGTMMQTWSE